MGLKQSTVAILIREEQMVRSWGWDDLASFMAVDGIGSVKIWDWWFTERPITEELAQGFARAFGTSVELWRNLQAAVDSDEEEKTNGKKRTGRDADRDCDCKGRPRQTCEAPGKEGA